MNDPRDSVVYRFGKCSGQALISAHSFTPHQHSDENQVEIRPQSDRLPKITLGPAASRSTIRESSTRNKIEGGKEPFPFECLPFELQDLILIEVGVSRASSSKTFGSAYGALASVCRRWRDVTRSAVFCENVKKTFVKRDSMKHYLHTAENIPVHGLSGRVIIKAVTAADHLYTIEEVYSSIGPVEVPYVYDVKYATVREVRERRQDILVTNRRRMEVPGLSYRVKHFLPCSQSGNIYVVEGYDNYLSRATVHLVTPELTALYRWNIGFSAEEIRNISLSTLDRYLIVVRENGAVYMYDATTGSCERTLERSTNDNRSRGNKFIAASATFVDEAPSRLVTSYNNNTRSSSWYWSRQNIAIVEDQTVLLMSEFGFRLIRRDFMYSREICIEGDAAAERSYSCSGHWYDSARGVVFCFTKKSKLVALRIKYSNK